MIKIKNASPKKSTKLAHLKIRSAIKAGFNISVTLSGGLSQKSDTAA